MRVRYGVSTMSIGENIGRVVYVTAAGTRTNGQDLSDSIFEMCFLKEKNVIWSKYHWCLFPIVQLVISRYWVSLMSSWCRSKGFCIVKVWEWIRNYTTHLTGHVIIYPRRNFKFIHSRKMAPCVQQGVGLCHVFRVYFGHFGTNIGNIFPYLMQVNIIKWWIIKLLKTLCFCTSSLEINQWNVHFFTPVILITILIHGSNTIIQLIPPPPPPHTHTPTPTPQLNPTRKNSPRGVFDGL